jgi:hypothetical protein
MIKRVALTKKQKVDIIAEYSEQLTPMITLAKQYAVSRQAIYKILSQAGVDTHKGKIPVSCTTCGKEIMRTKAVIRKRLNLFCGFDCYTAFLQAGNGKPYISSPYHGKLAREYVSKYFALQEQHRVHHEDRNQYNNRLDNLRVFANQGDHVRFHRGFNVIPIWDGSQL